MLKKSKGGRMFNREYLSTKRIGTKPHRSYYIPFALNDEFCFSNGILNREKSSLFISLNGEWKIKKHAAISSLIDISEKISDSINVPSCVQIHGLDGLQYINVRYPFPVDPPYVPDENPVYHYRKKVKLSGGEKYYLNFEGVDSAFYLFVNGKKVGYSQISHATSEFDITDYTVPGENVIDVVVLKWCASSYLEDQDKLRYTGIFRSVYILKRPLKHISDFKITTLLQLPNAVINVENLSDTPFDCLFAGKKYAVEVGKSVQITIKNAKLWTAERPYLYNLVLSAGGEKILQRIGVRSVAIENGIFKINGEHIKLKGVNRHESNCFTGATVTVEDTLKDIKLMKKLNVNAIRTSHYPDMPEFYDLCDKYGIYVMDEADIETHGMATRENGYDRETWQQFAQSEMYADAVCDREQALYERDKNRTCVIIWSLGNESNYGKMFYDGADYIHSRDSRPVHYESAWEMADKSEYYTNRIDIASRMYPPYEWLQNGYLDDEKETRPLVLCEYSHAMGNSNGDLADYWKVINGNDRFMGAFVWEWCDHAVMGEKGLLYGGDFGEKYHDDNFCVDGLVTADRKLKSNALEMQAVYGGKTQPSAEVSLCKPLMPLQGDSPLQVEFNDKTAGIDKIIVNGKNLLKQPIKLNWFRAWLDNDKYEHVWKTLPDARVHVRERSDFENGTTFKGVVARESLSPALKFELTYTLYNDAIDVKLKYETAKYIGYLPRIGVTFALPRAYGKFTFFGYGKGESYIDKRLYCEIGEYTLSVKDNMANNLMPQECGSHYYTSLLKTGNLEITAEKPFSFSMLPYSTEQLLKTSHSWELPAPKATYLCLDIAMSGVGSHSCGPELKSEYRAPVTGENTFRIKIKRD